MAGSDRDLIHGTISILAWKVISLL